MNIISDLMHSTGGTIAPPPPTQDPLQFQQTTISQQLLPQATMANPGGTSVPPEIIHLIVNYLDNRELVKVMTLNWTWAHICAAKLWEDVQYSANSNRIVFLITKSVQTTISDPPATVDLNAAIDTSLSSSSGLNSNPMITVQGEQEQPSGMRRRNSYPWPTLLPYHAMIHSLHVSLSSADMIQDLMEVIPCCTELRSFSIQSAIPTEDLWLRGVIASAGRDDDDPLQQRTALHLSPSFASTNTLASQSSGSFTEKRSHSHSQSLSLDPYNTTTKPKAGLDPADDETIMASSTSQSGRLLRLLASSCPKLEKLWFSGFHPVSVLGAATDLRPLPPKFDLKSYQNQIPDGRDGHGVSEVQAPRPPSFLNMSTLNPSAADGNANATLPPVPPVPGMNAAAISNPTLQTPVTVTSVPSSNQQAQSGIKSIHFTNCTLPPQYLLAMAQHSLPYLTEVHLTQCWQGNPLRGSFLRKLAKLCPGLKIIDLHATQSHRDLIRSSHILRMLQHLEGVEVGRPPKGHSVADYPLGTFRGTSSGSGWSASSHSSHSSALVPTPVRGNSTSDNAGVSSADEDMDDSANEDPTQLGVARRPSNLESISVWFTHSILDQAVVAELANKARHPKLNHVEFGSDDAFDVGEDLTRSLQQQRPEVHCIWVSHGDMGDDRDD
ncbi:hypothetical protein EMPS_07322 [Entomortierella parvispora]|uniref:F-box domain-containing protein n=1 Tax=Entomortierella parvispora TaxID=205924 RepID=A0A9P3LY92_9FUNG|nr:hypothetical protein EMPS_07322 [Entomortierella parvispora]